ncbi:MAG: RNA polymerase factor sigma-32 [Pseudomonadota bacterium]
MATIDTAESQRALRGFVKQAMAAPLLEQQEELNLARAWRDQQDEKSLHKLTEAYMRLVVSMATKFRGYGLPLNDLVQEGMIGLMQAAARFEPEREVRFSTYASWWIRSSLQDYILRNWSIVRTGTTSAQKSLFFNLRRLRAKIDGAGETLSEQAKQQISAQLKAPVREVEAMAGRLSGSDRSLNARLADEGDAEWQDLLPDDRSGPDEEVMIARDAKTRSAWINAALKGLTDRELTIIMERRLNEDTVTLAALGKRLGLSKERVRQIEHQALRKLRDALTEEIGDPVEAGLI